MNAVIGFVILLDVAVLFAVLVKVMFDDARDEGAQPFAEDVDREALKRRRVAVALCPHAQVVPVSQPLGRSRLKWRWRCPACGAVWTTNPHADAALDDEAEAS